jgi:hypothetical protein
VFVALRGAPRFREQAFERCANVHVWLVRATPSRRSTPDPGIASHHDDMHLITFTSFDRPGDALVGCSRTTCVSSAAMSGATHADSPLSFDVEMRDRDPALARRLPPTPEAASTALGDQPYTQTRS